MNKLLATSTMFLLMFLGLICGSAADAALYNFEITGSYQTALNRMSGPGLIFDAGDTFTISGVVDTDLQPVVDTKAYQDYIMQEVYYSRVISLNHDIPFDQINADYPSPDFGDMMGFNDTDVKTGSFFTGGIYWRNMDIYELYSHIFIARQEYPTPTMLGWIEFNFHEIVQPGGVHRWVGNTIWLNIDHFNISEVPVPSALVLFGAGIALFSGVRRKKIDTDA